MNLLNDFEWITHGEQGCRSFGKLLHGVRCDHEGGAVVGKRTGLTCMTLKTFVSLYSTDLAQYYGEDFDMAGKRINDHFSDSVIFCMVEEGPVRYTQKKRSPGRMGKERRNKFKHRYSFINPFNRIHGYAIVEGGNTNLSPGEKQLLSLSLICSSPFSDKRGVGSDLMDILKEHAKKSGYTDIILEVANELAETSVVEEEGEDEEEEAEESEDDDEEEGQEWEWYPSDEAVAIMVHELWRKTMRKDIDGDPYYNIEEEYIDEHIWRYFFNWPSQPEEKIPRKISDESDPQDDEYGGFWYKRGLESADGLCRFYRKHGFREERRVHLDWQCYGNVPYPAMILRL